MIDPKLNDLPVEEKSGFRRDRESDLTAEQKAERARRAKAGLSINDTIASDANMSIGGRGVDVSGVDTGVGAGAGTTNLTPGDAGGGSPAPTIVPRARTTGMTPRGLEASDQSPTTRLDQDASSPTSDEVSERAYRCWHERGCPHGSPEVDWDRAERELRQERERPRSTSAAAGSERR